MKRIFSMLLILVGLTTFAQESRGRDKDPTIEEMATLRAKRLMMQLDLNTEQEAKLKKLYTNRIESKKELLERQKENPKNSEAERYDMREERLEMSEEEIEELRAILTEAQFLKWEQLQEKRRKGRKNPVKQRQN